MLKPAFDALQAGDAPTAERLARLTLQQYPASEDALLVLALSLDAQARYADAFAVFRELSDRNPRVPEYKINAGAMLRLLGREDEAERCYADALALDAMQVEALRSLGEIAMRRGKQAAAQDFLLRAHAVEPRDAQIRALAATACVACGDTELAEQLLADWSAWGVADPASLADVAAALTNAGRYADAERALEIAALRRSGDARVQLRLAALYERTNRVAEAAAVLGRVDVGGDPTLCEEAAVVRATVAARGDDVAAAIRQHEAIVATPDAFERHLSVAFALARLYDRTLQPDAAMSLLGRAHAAQMRQLAAERPESAAFDTMSITRRRLTPELVATWNRAGAPDAGASPIFIVGFPRSGTTLLETMLDAHPALTTMDEQPFMQNLVAAVEERGLRYPQDLGALTPEDVDTLRDTYYRAVASRTQVDRSRRLVDKNPLNLLRLPMIMRVFPNARIVLALRHPCDVVLSNYLQLFNEPLYAPMCATLETTARGYADAFDAWIDHCRVLSPAVLELRHEDLVGDVPAAATRIADFLGVDRDPRMVEFHEHARRREFIGTPSYHQVVEPVNRKGVGRWERYRAYFEPALPHLEPYLRRWNYTS